MRTVILGAALVAAIASAAGAQINVSPGNMNGWQTYLFDDGLGNTSGSATFVNGIGSPPVGTGSLQLTTGQYGNGASRIATNNFNGLGLASITNLAYSSYSEIIDPSNGTSSTVHVYLSMRVDYNNDGDEDDVIFFEPEYQNGYTNAVPTQADATTGLWQTWNALGGGWWSANDTLGTGAAGANVRPLSDFVAAFPNAVITGQNGPGVRLTAGFGSPVWDNFTGYVDGFTIGMGNETLVYDFEATPTPGAAALFGLGGLAALRRRR